MKKALGLLALCLSVSSFASSVPVKHHMLQAMPHTKACSNGVPCLPPTAALVPPPAAPVKINNVNALYSVQVFEKTGATEKPLLDTKIYAKTGQSADVQLEERVPYRQRAERIESIVPELQKREFMSWLDVGLKLSLDVEKTGRHTVDTAVHLFDSHLVAMEHQADTDVGTIDLPVTAQSRQAAQVPLAAGQSVEFNTGHYRVVIKLESFG